MTAVITSKTLLKLLQGWTAISITREKKQHIDAYTSTLRVQEMVASTGLGDHLGR